MNSYSTNNPKPYAVITGASSGIGQIYAYELAKKGYDLGLCARRIDNLSKLKKELENKFETTVYIEKVDLLIREERTQFFKNTVLNRTKELKKHQSSKDYKQILFINNAGFGTVSSFSEVSIDREIEMTQLNCTALLELTFLAYKEMKNLGFGSIINIGSVASFTPMTYMTTYGATKAFVHSFTMALYGEARKHGVHVMSHLPGPTESEFHLAAGLKTKINRIDAMKTDVVVKEALSALDKKRPVCINGYGNKMLSFLLKICPAPIAAKIVEKILHSPATSNQS